MNIENALTRVSELCQEIDDIQSFLRKAEAPGANINGAVRVNFGGYIKCPAVSRERCLEMLNIQLQADQAELDRLKPIIDMANLALAGLSAESEF